MEPGPNFRLDGRVALVTGAAHGLGFSIAEGLGLAGAAVVLADLDEAGASARADDLRQRDVKTVALRMDVTDPVSVQAAVEGALAHFGRLDVLVNNAGLKNSGLPGDRASSRLAQESWQRMVDVNLNGVFYCCQAAYEPLRARGGGSIINLASIYGLVASRIGPGSPYSATKAGVIGLTRALAVEWAADGIRVNALAPTHIEPREDDPGRGAAAPEYEEQIRWRTPIGRRGAQAEIVGPAVFLASDASRLITGHTLAVDGGWTAW